MSIAGEPLASGAKSIESGKFPRMGKYQIQVPVVAEVHTDPPVNATKTGGEPAGGAAFREVPGTNRTSAMNNTVANFIRTSMRQVGWRRLEM